jgi:hypothetical protein
MHSWKVDQPRDCGMNAALRSEITAICKQWHVGRKSDDIAQLRSTARVNPPDGSIANHSGPGWEFVLLLKLIGDVRTHRHNRIRTVDVLSLVRTVGRGDGWSTPVDGGCVFVSVVKPTGRSSGFMEPGHRLGHDANHDRIVGVDQVWLQTFDQRAE